MQARIVKMSRCREKPWRHVLTLRLNIKYLPLTLPEELHEWTFSMVGHYGCTARFKSNAPGYLSFLHEKIPDLPFFAATKVHIISSLPYFSKTTDHQRVMGFWRFHRSLHLLNEQGYGRAMLIELWTSFTILPGLFTWQSIGTWNRIWRQLKRRFDVDFDHLFVITNLPIARFLDHLISSGNYLSYMEELGRTFNPATIDGLMCRYTLSVGWTGRSMIVTSIKCSTWPVM